MGCGASHPPTAEGDGTAPGGPQKHKGLRYVDDETVSSVTEQKTEVYDVDVDRRSVSRVTTEPGTIKSAMRHQYRVMKARVEHGINDDPEQYQDEVDRAVPTFREKDRLRVMHWLHEVIQPKASKMPTSVRSKELSTDNTVAGDVTPLNLSSTKDPPVLPDGAGAKQQRPPGTIHNESDGSAGSSTSSAPNRSKVPSPEVSTAGIGASRDGNAGSMNKSSTSRREKAEVSFEPQSMDFVLNVDNGESPADQSLNAPGSHTQRQMLSSLTSPNSALGASVLSWRSMDISRTGLDSRDSGSVGNRAGFSFASEAGVLMYMGGQPQDSLKEVTLIPGLPASRASINPQESPASIGLPPALARKQESPVSPSGGEYASHSQGAASSPRPLPEIEVSPTNEETRDESGTSRFPNAALETNPPSDANSAASHEPPVNDGATAPPVAVN